MCVCGGEVVVFAQESAGKSPTRGEFVGESPERSSDDRPARRYRSLPSLGVADSFLRCCWHPPPNLPLRSCFFLELHQLCDFFSLTIGLLFFVHFLG